MPRLRLAKVGRDLCVHLAQPLLQQGLPEQGVQATAEDLVRSPQNLLQERKESEGRAMIIQNIVENFPPLRETKHAVRRDFRIDLSLC